MQDVEAVWPRAFGDAEYNLQFSLLAVWTPGDVNPSQPLHYLLNRFFDYRGQPGIKSKQLAAYFQIFFLVAVSEKPIMADSHKPFGQHMEQKASDKLHGIDVRLLFLVRVSIFIAKNDIAFVQGYNAVVGNRHPMGVAAKVVEHIFGLAHIRACRWACGCGPPMGACNSA